MRRLLGIDFSPLFQPWDKKLQTLGVIIIFIMVIPMFAVSLVLPFILFFTFQWHILFLYWLWFLYDRNSPYVGGYNNPWLRRWRYNEWAARYFPSNVHKTVDLPANRNYLFACHPHGVICYGLYSAFIREIDDDNRKFPGLHFVACTLASNFYHMIRREWLLLSGYIDCSKESIRNAFARRNAGQAVILVIGGAEEALYARPGSYKLKLLTRKGFIKQALRCGASLVPVYTFGENDIYDQIEVQEGSMLYQFQMWVKRHVGVTVPIFYGTGLFQLNFGFLPYRTPLNTVVGAPIDVPKVDEPTDEEVECLHRQYIETLTELFEKHKTRFGVPEETRLILV
ncbi:hypothetical protein V3C99_004065 [Haemonchus contortus]